MANYVKSVNDGKVFTLNTETGLVDLLDLETVKENDLYKAPTLKDMAAYAEGLLEAIAKASKRKARGTSETAAAKKAAADAIRETAKGLIVEKALEAGWTAKENENVPNVVKFYDESDKFILYARFGLKSIQFLLKEDRVPKMEPYTLMKYSLPASVVLEYNAVMEDFTDPETGTTVKVISERAEALIG